MSSMEGSIIGFIIALCVVQTASQSIPRCLRSREDFVLCRYRNMNIMRANPKYVIVRVIMCVHSLFIGR
jgi:hypothetical protein